MKRQKEEFNEVLVKGSGNKTVERANSNLKILKQRDIGVTLSMPG